MKFNYGQKIAVSTAALLVSAVLNAEVWDSKFYDPKPIDGTVILPMPCDGAMAFRIVPTNTRQPLEDKAIVLGSETNDLPVAEYATQNYIAGAFDSSEGRYYLIGKYEVTEDQYKAVMGETCPTPNMKGRMPITSVSWFDAVAFTHKYNEWLMQNHKDKLPLEDGKSGFLRLPTNTEWEYAARGGASVSESEFRERTFPVPEGLDKYVWFSGTKSANGKLQLVGNREANPLGLFDVLGNVNEMMFDSFKMNKLDRYHGQNGGVTLRGGSYLTPEEQISSAYRVEVGYYNDEGTAFKSKETGFRVAIASPVITSSKRVKDLETAWQALGKDQNNQDQTIVNDLGKIVAQTDDKKIKTQLKSLEDALRASNQQKDEQRDQAIRSAVQLGAFLCTNTADLERQYQNTQKYYDTFCHSETANQSNCAAAQEKAKSNLDVRDFVLKYYADNVVETATVYPKNTVATQINSVMDKLNLQGKSNLNSFVNVYWGHLQSYYANGNVDRDNWLKSCVDMASIPN